MNGIMLALLAGGALLVSPDRNDGASVRESWVGSRELPTAIAYYEFTRLLAESRKAPHASAHLLADALGESDIDALGPNVIRELRSQGESFIAQFESMQLEILETRLRMLCTPSVSRRASEVDALPTFAYFGSRSIWRWQSRACRSSADMLSAISSRSSRHP